jgi:predicted MFS family arabinose efflux permease
MVINLSPTIAPAIGGYVQKHFGWHANFYAQTFFVLFSLLMVIFYLPETHKTLNRKALSLRRVLSTYFKLLTHFHFVSFSLCSGLALSVMLVNVTLAPFIFIKQLGMSPEGFGMITLGYGSVWMVGRFVSISVVQRASLMSGLLLGECLVLLGALLLLGLFLSHLIGIKSVLFCSMLYALGVGCVFPSAVSFAMSSFPATMGGACGALYSAIQVGCTATVGMVVSHLPSQSPIVLSMTLFILSLFALSLIGYIIFYRPIEVSE